jgi:hypothetical protein
MFKHVSQVTNNHSSSQSLRDRNAKMKPTPTIRRYKSLLSCVVCNGDAHGYNFDAISCESCKAFFRRNALRPPGKLKCRANGQCSVTVDQRKRCKKCRLDKCFQSGMRKEWILSEAEKKEKKKRIEENRHFKQVHDNDQEYQEEHNEINLKIDDESTSSDSIYQCLMTEFDLLKIQHIEASYTEAVKFNTVVGIPLYPSIYPILSILDLLQVPVYLAAIRLITYFKHIPEFNQLDQDDKIILVKNNMLPILFIHTALIYDPKTDSFHEHNTDDPIFEVIHPFRMIDETFDYKREKCIQNLTNIIGHDRTIVKLLVLIVLFAKDSCVPESSNESNFNDQSSILFVQNIYIDLLYKYSLNQYGWLKTATLFTRLIGQLIHLQDYCAEMKRIVREQIDLTQLSPMMHSLL